MSYTYMAEISRKDAGCILFLLDQSASMSDPFAGDRATTKAKSAADAINKLLTTLILRCTQNIGEGPRNYFDVGVIGYGQRSGVGPCLGGALSGRDLVSIKDLASNHLRVENRTRKVSNGAGGLVETTSKFPVWFDPIAESGTPMLEAMQLAQRTLEPWLERHQRSYPPIVINITDGEPNNDPSVAAKALSNLESDDGRVLLYNIHLSSLNRPAIRFPASDNGLPDQFARMLFDISSELPARIVGELGSEGIPAEPGARGFVFNADAEGLIQFLDIGTRLVLEGTIAER